MCTFSVIVKLKIIITMTMMKKMRMNLRTRLVMMCLLLVCSAVRKRGEGGREGVGGRSSIA